VKNLFFILFICLITTISFADSPKSNTLIECNAFIEGKFSGVEMKPIVESFYTWMNVSNGAIKISPPTEVQRAYFYKVMRHAINDPDQLDLDATRHPTVAWGGACSKDFFVIRVLSIDPIVRLIDNSKNSGDSDKQFGVLAYTFLGCRYKFIAVVADRIEDEEMLKAVILHELGHMWGLLDNEKGNSSIMNGVYPMSKCITKSDIIDLYEAHKKNVPSNIKGCNP
jgi:hypothetical protein